MSTYLKPFFYFEFVLLVASAFPVFGVDPIPLQKDDAGRILLPNGQRLGIASILCQIDILAFAKGKGSAFRIFRDFLKSGGSGRIVRLSTPLDRHQENPEYGYYLEVSAVPPSADPNSTILWLRDPHTLAAVQKSLTEGHVFLRASEETGYLAAVVKGNKLLDGMLLHQMDGKYDKYPGLVLTENTDEFVLRHEMQHFYDGLEKPHGFLTSKLASEISSKIQDTELLKGGLNPFGDTGGHILSFILEQRADAAKIRAMKEELGKRTTILVRKKGTKTKFEEIDFSTYYKQMLAQTKGARLGYQHKGSYGSRAYEALKEIQKISPQKAREFRTLIAKNCLPSEEIGVDQLLPGF